MDIQKRKEKAWAEWQLVQEHKVPDQKAKVKRAFQAHQRFLKSGAGDSLSGANASTLEKYEKELEILRKMQAIPQICRKRQI